MKPGSILKGAFKVPKTKQPNITDPGDEDEPYAKIKKIIRNNQLARAK